MSEIAVEDKIPREAIKQLSAQIQELKEKIESEYTLLYGLMQAIIAEFDDHRKALILFLEANGIPCDDIKGWTINNDEEEEEKEKNNVTNRKSKGLFRSKNDRKRTKRKKRKRKKHDA